MIRSRRPCRNYQVCHARERGHPEPQAEDAQKARLSAAATLDPRFRGDDSVTGATAPPLRLPLTCKSASSPPHIRG
jgi:hypothetical protein